VLLAGGASAVAAALRAGSGRVGDGAGGSGTRDAAASAFAAGLVGFAVLLARRARWRMRAGDAASVVRALADLPCVGAELIPADASLIGGPAVRSGQTKRLVHDPAVASGGG
jgi:hypothetical protein